MVLSQENTRAAYAKRQVHSRAPRLWPKHSQPVGHALSVTDEKDEMTAIHFQIIKRCCRLVLVKTWYWCFVAVVGYRRGSQLWTRSQQPIHLNSDSQNTEDPRLHPQISSIIFGTDTIKLGHLDLPPSGVLERVRRWRIRVPRHSATPDPKIDAEPRPRKPRLISGTLPAHANMSPSGCGIPVAAW